MKPRSAYKQPPTREERKEKTLPAKAAKIVADRDLLCEVLRRAAFIEPALVEDCLLDARARMSAAKGGGYIEKFVLPNV